MVHRLELKEFYYMMNLTEKIFIVYFLTNQNGLVVLLVYIDLIL